MIETERVWWTRLADRRIGLALLAAVLVTGAALRLWLSFHDDGIYWPDEIYGSLEPAHRLVFGRGLISWEFIEGARGWTLPGLVAGLLKLCALAGLDEPRQYLSVVRVAFSAIGVATAAGSYVLARRLGASFIAAASGAAFFALAGPSIYFAPRALAETASALPVAFGMALALPGGASRRERVIGASLLGLATLLRLQNGLFCVGLLCVLAGERRSNALRDVAIVLVCWAAAFGLLDRLTWGEWFQSARVYLHASITLGAAPITGTSPPSYYVVMFLRSMPWVTIVVGALCLIALPRARGLAFVTFAFFLAHVAIPNKAYRYILPALPLFGALAALGLQRLADSGRRGVAAAAAFTLVAVVAWNATGFHQLTFGAVGPYERTRPDENAYDEEGPVNRLLIAASRQSDLCGLRVESEHLTWTGGYSYFHRSAPLYSPTGPPRASNFYNYVIVPLGQDAGEVVASDHDRVLGRLPNRTCHPDSTYDSRLPGFDRVHEILRSR